jgi:RHS repeat-associated protein
MKCAIANRGLAAKAMRSALLKTCRAMLALAVVLPAFAQTEIPGARASSFTYLPNGLLESETIEPGSPDFCVTTSYTYDSWGNKNEAWTRNCTNPSPPPGSLAPFTPRRSGSTYAEQTVLVGSTSVTIPAGQFATAASNALYQAETRTYDPRFGVVTKLTGPNGLDTKFTYDDFGRKLTEVRADGTWSSMAYCILGAVAGLSTGLDPTSNSADCANVSFQTNEVPANAVSFVQSRSFDKANAQLGPFSRVYKDRQGRVVREVSETLDSAAQSNTGRTYVAKDTVYNTYGVAVLATAPYFLGPNSSTLAGNNDMGVSLTKVDALGRVIQVDVADPKGNVGTTDIAIPSGYSISTPVSRTLMTYEGLKTTSINSKPSANEPKGQKRVEEKNADGKVVRVADAYGGQVVHQHDAFGNLIKTKDALGTVVSITYDIRGRKTKMVDPDTGTWIYGYNGLGELVEQQSPKQTLATKTTMTYDLLGRMTKRVEPEYQSDWFYDKRESGAYCMDAVPGVAAPGVGKLCETKTSLGVNKKFQYDNKGRPTVSRSTIEAGNGEVGASFATAVSYQANSSRVLTQTYPTGVKVQFEYSTRGFVKQVNMATSATVAAAGSPAVNVLWTAGTVNAWGRSETQTLGNGVTSRAEFDKTTGRLNALKAGLGASTSAVDQSYFWDSLSNLTQRVDRNAFDAGVVSVDAVTEDFTYDDINRLTRYVVNAPQIPNSARTVDMHYNAIGNLLYKSDVGNYEYPTFGVNSVKPHAVSRVAGGSAGTIGYTYDNSGNMTSATGGKYSSVSYTSFNLPDGQAAGGLAGPGGTPRYTWQYDENHQRIRETRVNTTGTRITWSLHPDNVGGLGFESERSPAGTLSNRHYVSAGGQTVVLVTAGALPGLGAGVVEPPALSSVVFVKVEYWHKDHLGSLVATTNHLGAVTARYAYDPFGRRRATKGTYDPGGNLIVDWMDGAAAGTDRGYTGHEHLDDVGVIHMNGRIFDPTIARFMQGDPFIQDPSNLQNYNRYTYCYNNPLTCTDPSGFDFWSEKFRNADPVYHARPGGAVDNYLAGWAFYGIRHLPGQVGIDNYVMSHPWLYALGMAAASYWGGPYAAAAISGYTAYINSGGSVEQARRASLISLGTSYAMSSVGDLTNSGGAQSAWQIAGNIAGHAAVGCISSEVSGGSCREGALAAGVSAGAGFVAGDAFKNSPVGGLAYSMVVGGIAAQLGGGKFANGAVTAAYGYLFNAMQHMAGEKPTAPITTGDPYIDGTLSTLNDLALQALSTSGEGRGPVFGTKVHFEFSTLVTGLGRTDLFTEQSFSFSGLVAYGTDGSIRTDVILGKDPTRPVAIFDLKTGSARLTQARADEIRARFPGFKGPIIGIYPQVCAKPPC